MWNDGQGGALPALLKQQRPPTHVPSAQVRCGRPRDIRAAVDAGAMNHIIAPANKPPGLATQGALETARGMSDGLRRGAEVRSRTKPRLVQPARTRITASSECLLLALARAAVAAKLAKAFQSREAPQGSTGSGVAGTTECRRWSLIRYALVKRRRQGEKMHCRPASTPVGRQRPARGARPTDYARYLRPRRALSLGRAGAGPQRPTHQLRALQWPEIGHTDRGRRETTRVGSGKPRRRVGRGLGGAISEKLTCTPARSCNPTRDEQATDASSPPPAEHMAPLGTCGVGGPKTRRGPVRGDSRDRSVTCPLSTSTAPLFRQSGPISSPALLGDVARPAGGPACDPPEDALPSSALSLHRVANRNARARPRSSRTRGLGGGLPGSLSSRSGRADLASPPYARARKRSRVSRPTAACLARKSPRQAAARLPMSCRA